jgi:ribose transport system permease protein
VHLKVSKNNNRKKINIMNYIVFLVFLLIIIVFAIVLRDKGFLQGQNLMNIARQTAVISVLAVGMTFALASGEIDLSVGSVIAISSITVSLLLRNYNIWIAVIATLAVGLVIGSINGFLVTVAKIPSFLVTLGMMGVIFGVARWVTNLAAIPIINNTFSFIFGSGSFGPVSVLFIWTIVVLIVGQVLLRKTTFGRYTLAAGGNRTAAIFSGIKVSKIKFFDMVVCTLMATLGGLMTAGRLRGGRYTFGEEDLMTVLAAVVIGGNSLFGGKATVIGAVIGSLIMGTINNGLILMGLSVAQQMVFRGLIIIFAVAISSRSESSN